MLLSLHIADSFVLTSREAECCILDTKNIVNKNDLNDNKTRE